MPCWPAGFRADPPPRRKETAEDRIEAIRLTRMLCALCAVLQEMKLVDVMSDELKEWWQEHRKADEARVDDFLSKERRARIVRDVYKRLTPEQRVAIWGEESETKPVRKARRKKTVQ